MTKPLARDFALDLARVFCILVVVLAHMALAAIAVTPHGIEVDHTLEQHQYFTVASWFLQVMPLFFAIGGAVAMMSARSGRHTGESDAEQLRSRLWRILRPALLAYAFIAVVTVALSAAGVGGELVAAAAAGAGTPLWYIAAFVVTQAGLTPLARWHQRAPKATLILLVAGAVLVDCARFASGIEWLGYLNIAFVWLAAQQLGFWYADGFFERIGTTGRAAVVVGCALVLALLLGFGPYASNLLANQSPPTLPLLAIAPAQLAVLSLIAPALRRAVRFKVVAVPAFLIGSRALTFYLWNIPVILSVTGLMLLAHLPMPTPYSGAWWLSRIPFVLVVVTALVLLAKPIGKFEERRLDPRPIASTRVWLAALLGFVPAFIEQASALTMQLAVAGTLATAAAVVLIDGRPPRQWIPRPTKTEHSTTKQRTTPVRA